MHYYEGTIRAGHELAMLVNRYLSIPALWRSTLSKLKLMQKQNAFIEMSSSKHARIHN